MRRFVGRSGIPVAVLLAVIGLAACGGSSSNSSNSGNSGNSAKSGTSTAALSVSDYSSKVSAALTPYVSAAAAAAKGGSDPAPFSQMETASKQASATLSGLTPPSSVADINSKLASCLNNVSTAAGKIATALQNKDVTAAQAEVPAYNSAGEACRPLVQQLKDKGVTLIASGNSGSSGSSGNS